MTNDIVYQGIIRGTPVASAHKGRLGVINGHARYFPSAEWSTWFPSAITQTEATLLRGGHRVERTVQITKTGPHKGKPSKNAHGQLTNVTNPLFVDKQVRIIVWYFHPMHTYVKDIHGNTAMTTATKKTPARPKTKIFQKLDSDNVIKGVIDALEEGGVIDNDKHCAIPVVVHMPTLHDNAEAYVAIQVKGMDYGNTQDWVIPYPCPVSDIDTTLYMPRIFDGGHAWHVIKEQERNYQNLTGRTTPVAKATCRRCTALIGEGFPQTEIWWNRDVSRWGDEVVLVCGGCGADQFRKVPHIDTQIDERTLAVCAKNNITMPTIPLNTHEDRLIFNAVRRKVEDQLKVQYREKYCIVESKDIGTTSWATIGARWSSVKDTFDANSGKRAISSRERTDGTSEDSPRPTKRSSRAPRPVDTNRLLAARHRQHGGVGSPDSGD